MALPVVAIIGRPNVGKSSLLNALAGQMISIVEPQPGVTRDRISTIIEYQNKFFELIDTGGYGIVDSDLLTEHVERQIQQAMTQADLILFMTDIRDGVTPLDQTIAEMLRKQNLNVMGVANKADNARFFPQAAEFNRLGFGEFLCISATQNLNKQVLLDRIHEQVKDLETDRPAQATMKIALVGKRNAGKSTFINALAGSERVIVSEVPGTTRDAVDVRIEKDGKTMVVIDTAGVRKKGKMSNDIEYYSFVRATRSIKRADLVLFMIDAMVPISQVDNKLAKLIIEEYKACILVINKWDLAKKKANTEEFEDYLTDTLPQLKRIPIAFTTAQQGKNVHAVIDLASELFKQATTKISTAKINKAFEIIKSERVGTPKKAGGRPKIYYATQVAISPVTLLLFVNNVSFFEPTYRRYIVGRLQELLGIEEVPIRLLIRNREKRAD